MLVFTDGAIRRGGDTRTRRRTRRLRRRPIRRASRPSIATWIGRISDDKTVPQLKKFVESGGTIVTIGSSTSIAEVFGIPGEELPDRKGPRRPRSPAAAREVLYPRLAAAR